MKRTDLPKQLQAILQKIPYVTIATVCDNGQPWNTPVVGCFDDKLNLYWVSWKDSQHSKNIAREPRIFVVVYDSRAPEGSGKGLYLRMTARSLENRREVSLAGTMYDTSFFRLQDGSLPTFTADCPNRIYKAFLQDAWVNVDASKRGHFIDTRERLRK